MAIPFIERHIRPHVLEALADTRVVALLGARQVGKSTLAQSISERGLKAAAAPQERPAYVDLGG